LEVRRAAVRAATALHVSGSALLHVIADRGPTAVESAFLALENAGALAAEDLEALATSEDDVVRQVVSARR
jgi:hypothetical protein